jgi:hypothetical protein
LRRYGEGAGAVAHTGNGKFDEHLLAVKRVLRAWGANDDLADAGLFHSIYGTEGFQGFCIPFDRRAGAYTRSQLSLTSALLSTV